MKKRIIVLGMIFMMLSIISYTKLIELPTENFEQKKYICKVGVLTKEPEFLDQYAFVYVEKENITMDLPVRGEYDCMKNKGDLVLVLEEGEKTSRVRFVSNYPPVTGVINNSDISYDVELFKKSELVFVNENVGLYNEKNGKESEDIYSGIGAVSRREEGWIEVFFEDGYGPFLIKDTDINYNYNEALSEEDRTVLDI